MTAAQVPESALSKTLSNLEIIRFTSTVFEFSAVFIGTKIIFQYEGTGLDTSQDPLINSFDIFDANRSLLLSVFDFNHKMSD